MSYSNRTIKEIPKWLECPMCYEYSTKVPNYLIEHFNNCDEYDDHIDDINEHDFGHDETIEEYIHIQMNMINTTKVLIKTNELNIIRDQSFNDVHLYIKNKLINNSHNYIISDDRLDECARLIYDFFFGMTEQSDKMFNDSVMKWMNYLEGKT